MNSHCDGVVLFTGDTDLAPSVRDAKRLFPTKGMYFGIPCKRNNQELNQIVRTSFTVDKVNYRKHPITDPYVLKSRRFVAKPNEW